MFENSPIIHSNIKLNNFGLSCISALQLTKTVTNKYTHMDTTRSQWCIYKI